MNVTLWILQVLLGLFFLIVGAVKAFRHERALSAMPWVDDVPRGLVTFIGYSEMSGGAGLILPGAIGMSPLLISVAALGLAVVMLHAGAFHAMRREYRNIWGNLGLLLAACVIAYGRLVARLP